MGSAVPSDDLLHIPDWIASAVAEHHPPARADGRADRTSDPRTDAEPSSDTDAGAHTDA
jgi:hypothetical protein